MSSEKQIINDHSRMRTIFIGEYGVGKTSLMKSLKDDSYQADIHFSSDYYTPSKVVERNGLKINVLMWDTYEQERFKSLGKIYFRGTHIAFIIYDKTNKESFDAIPEWIHTADERCGPEIIKILIGMKVDDKEHEVITYDQGKAIADQFNIPFLELSSQQPSEINVIEFAVDRALEKHIEGEHVTYTPYVPHWYDCAC